MISHITRLHITALRPVNYIYICNEIYYLLLIFKTQLILIFTTKLNLISYVSPHFPYIKKQQNKIKCTVKINID